MGTADLFPFNVHREPWPILLRGRGRPKTRPVDVAVSVPWKDCKVGWGQVRGHWRGAPRTPCGSGGARRAPRCLVRRHTTSMVGSGEGRVLPMRTNYSVLSELGSVRAEIFLRFVVKHVGLTTDRIAHTALRLG